MVSMGAGRAEGQAALHGQGCNMPDLLRILADGPVGGEGAYGAGVHQALAAKGHGVFGIVQGLELPVDIGQKLIQHKVVICLLPAVSKEKGVIQRLELARAVVGEGAVHHGIHHPPDPGLVVIMALGS